jgi:hypothetical protein
MCGKAATGVQKCVWCSTLVSCNSFTKIVIKIGAWPPSSPDLSQPDFFVCSYINNRVYATHPRDIRDLRDKIASEFEQITPQMLDKTCKHWLPSTAYFVNAKEAMLGRIDLFHKIQC